MLFQITFVFIFLILLLVLGKWRSQEWNFPPGPVGLPILGSFFSLMTASFPYIKLSEWANVFGGIYTITILTKNVVVVSCPKLLRQVFEHPASAGKYQSGPLRLMSGGHYGVSQTEGSTWLEQRRFCVRTLRQFGMGKRNEIQSSILSEAGHTIESIRNEATQNDGLIKSPIDFVKTGVNKTLWKVVRGDKMPLDYKKVESLTGDLADSFNVSIKTGLAIFPQLEWIAPKWSGYTNLAESCERLRNFIREQFEEHQTNRDSEEGESSDMMDVYIDQMKKIEKAGDTNSTFYGAEGMMHSIAVFTDLFAAGGESTPHTLNWLLLYLIHHQDIQSKLQQEIDQVLGTQEPCLQDKSRMPYTAAVLLEILRLCPAFTTTAPHTLTEDVDSLCGFKLPKGTLLIGNIYQAHMNKQFWGDPELFRPERFLPENSEEEKIVAERKASVVVFNVGKRACIGEPLALDILFLFAVKLFQVFHMLPFPENIKPDYSSSEPLVLMAKPFSIVVRERKRV